jgi:Bacterial low temperature requirement A protein (LtrA)
MTNTTVTPLELFCDLVFVFAFIQVTGFLAHHLSWMRMLQRASPARAALARTRFIRFSEEHLGRTKGVDTDDLRS